MTNSAKKQSFYLHMIGFLRNAFAVLDEQGKEEVQQFILGQQNPDGGFQDRGSRSDLYYSLFGWMILKAGSPINPTEGDFLVDSVAWSQLRQFVICQSYSEVPGFIEKCCLILLQKEFNINRISRVKALFVLVKSFWKERHSINLSYRGFVLFLTLDAVLPFSGFLKVGAKKMAGRTLIDENSPCPEVAARVFLQKMMNQDGSKDEELLKTFACETGGFKAFAHLNYADILSTAVALFALNFADCDLRLLKPACLDFIQQNFSGGAFLSGDGDQTKDLEYTFYGLLALGILAT